LPVAKCENAENAWADSQSIDVALGDMANFPGNPLGHVSVHSGGSRRGSD